MKTTLRELIERVEQLETALERTLGAMRGDLQSIREELTRLDTDLSTRPTKPPAMGAKRTVSEELALRKKAKDPRSDE